MSIILTTFDSPNCSIEEGRSSTLFLLPDTNSMCVPFESIFYSLDISSKSLLYACSPNCTQCALNISSWNTDTCVQTSGASISIQLFADSVNTLSQVCVGPLKKPSSPSFYVMLFSNPNCVFCSESFKPSVLTTYYDVGRGNGECSQSNSSLGNYEISGASAVEQNTFNLLLFCNSSTCAPTACEIEEITVLPGVCRQINNQNSILLLKRISYCGPWNPLPLIEIVVPSVLGAIVLTVTIIACFRNRESVKKKGEEAKENLKWIAQKTRDSSKWFFSLINSFFKGSFQSFSSLFEFSLEETKRSSVLPSFLIFLSFLPYLGFVFVYIYSSPFSVFSSSVLRDLGISLEYIKNDDMQQNFLIWSLSSAYLLAVSVSMGIILLLVQFILKPSAKKFFWLRILALSLPPLTEFFALLVYPFLFLRFRTMIQLKPNADSYLTKTAQVRHYVDNVIGLVFSATSLQYITALVLFFFHSISSSVVQGSLLFLITRKRRVQVEESKPLLVNQEPEEVEGVRGVNLRRNANLMMMIPFLQVLLQIMPVIFLLQTFGADYYWQFAWYTYFLFLVLTNILHKNLFHVMTQSRNPKKKHFVLAVFLSIFNLLFTIGLTSFILFKENGYLTAVSGKSPSPIVIAQVMLVASSYGSFTLLSFFSLKSVEKENVNQENGREVPPPNSPSEPWKPTRSKKMNKILKWILEVEERKKEERIVGRRIFLLVGTVALLGLNIISAYHLASTTAEGTINSVLKAFGYNVQWPSGKILSFYYFLLTLYIRIFAGNDLFTPAIKTLREAQTISLIFSLIAFLCLCFSVRFDVFAKRDKLRNSKYFVYLASFFISLSVLSVPFFNYLRESNIASICPYCAPRFNKMVEFVSQNLIGLLICAALLDKFVIVIVSIPISFVRASTLMIEGRAKEGGEYVSLVHIIKVSCLSSFPLTVVIALMFYQISPSSLLILLLLLSFWTLPCVWLLSAYFYLQRKRIKKQDTRLTEMKIYYFWLLLYISCILGLTIEQFWEHGALSILFNALKNPSFFPELFAEICISNVLISDLIYDLLKERIKSVEMTESEAEN